MKPARNWPGGRHPVSLNATTKIELVSQLDSLSDLEQALDGFVAEHNLDAASAFALRLVLEELTVNVIKHAFPDAEKPQPFSIQLGMSEDKTAVEIEMEDSGFEFDPVAFTDSAPTATEETVGGFGIFLVREKSRDFRYQRSEDRNQISLKVDVTAKS